MEADLLVSIDGEQYARHYNDSPGWPHPDCEWEAERAFRDAFVAAAREAAEWNFPDMDQIEGAWEARREARRKAEVLVTSAQLFNDPKWDEYDPPGTHYVYRIGHEVEASRTRGRHHAMEFCKRDWWELADLGFDDDEEIRRLFMRPWVNATIAWASEPIDSGWGPPRPLDHYSPVQWHAVLSKQKGVECVFGTAEDAKAELKRRFGSWSGQWKCRDKNEAVIGHILNWPTRYTNTARLVAKCGNHWVYYDRGAAKAMTTTPCVPPEGAHDPVAAGKLTMKPERPQ